MGVQNWSDNVVLVELPAEPRMKDEIQSVTEIAYDKHDCDVIMDFSSVDIVTSTSLVGLLILCELLTNCGNKLVLCNVSVSTRGIFAVTGLEGIFEFVDDKFVALASLQATS